MSIEIIPSILAADFGRLTEHVQEALAAGVTKVQIDVMDGSFVPNISVGLPVVKALARSTSALLDVHLMIDRPERYLEAFVDAGAAVVTVHCEATPHVHRAVARVRELGALAGAAINPGTPVAALEEVLGDVDVALLMTVDPGFGGQSFLKSVLPKIRRLRTVVGAGTPVPAIQVDGGIDERTAPLAVSAGATELVAGSSVFAAGVPVHQAVARLLRAVEGTTGDL